MTECCEEQPIREETPRRLCPADGRPGTPVAWLTVAALTRGAVPPRQSFWLCRNPHCNVVYFGADGRVFGSTDVRVQPGFKVGSDGLLCYCFEHRRADVVRELAETGETTVFESIRTEVRARNCACEVRNPFGKCCLGDVRAVVRELMDANHVTKEKSHGTAS